MTVELSGALIPVLVTGIQPPRVCAVNESKYGRRVFCAPGLGRAGFLWQAQEWGGEWSVPGRHTV